MTRIALFNDTSVWHSGSAAVMSVIRSWFRPEEITAVLASAMPFTPNLNPVDFDAFDAVVFNAEGTCHHDAPAAVFWLELLAECKRRGKRVAMVNATWAEMSPRYVDIISEFDYVSTREQYSTLELRCQALYPDEYIDLSVVSTLPVANKGTVFKPQGREIVYGTNWRGHQLDSQLSAGVVGLGVPRGTVDDFLKFVEFLSVSADTYITGQFHGVCAAAAAGINVVYLPGNCHKIEGMIAASGLPIPRFAKYKISQLAVAARFAQPRFHEWAMRLAEKTSVELPLRVKDAVYHV
jgi:hypothetical protein